MKKIYSLILLVAVSLSAQYPKNKLGQIIFFGQVDTSKSAFAYQTSTNDSANLSVQIFIDSAAGVVGAGRFAPCRNNAGSLTGMYRYYPVAASLNGDCIRFLFASSTANYVCEAVDLHTTTMPDSINGTITSRAAAASYTATRAGYLDSLNNIYMRAASYTAPDNAGITALRTSLTQDSLNALTRASAASLTGDSTNNLTHAKAANLTADSLLIKALQASVTGDSTNVLTRASGTDYTSARAGKLDSLDRYISSRMATFTYTPPDNASITIIRDTVNEARRIADAVQDSTDAKTSSRMATFSYTAPDNTSIAAILDSTDAKTSSRAPAATALSTAQWTNTRAGYLDSLSVALAKAATALSTANWTNTRAGYLDSLSVSLAKAATALSTANWTTARAGKLDSLKNCDVPTSTRAVRIVR